MTTSTTKLIAILATAAGLLMANAALAKGGKGGGGGGNGGNNGNRMSSNSMMTKQFSNNFVKSNQFSNNFVKSNQFSNNFVKSNPIHTNQFKSNFLVNKNHDSGFKVNFGGNQSKVSQLSKPSKDFFKKNDFHCKDNHCYWNWNHCYYPSTFGCYYPVYGCYNYYTAPCYSQPISTFNSRITVLPEVVEPRTKVAVGSMLMVDGQAFGDGAGTARLLVGGQSVTIEVLEWTASAVKIRLPQFELAGSTLADIEVLRADGSLASKTAIELMAASASLALAP